MSYTMATFSFFLVITLSAASPLPNNAVGSSFPLQGISAPTPKIKINASFCSQNAPILHIPVPVRPTCAVRKSHGFARVPLNVTIWEKDFSTWTVPIASCEGYVARSTCAVYFFGEQSVWRSKAPQDVSADKCREMSLPYRGLQGKRAEVGTFPAYPCQWTGTSTSIADIFVITMSSAVVDHDSKTINIPGFAASACTFKDSQCVGDGVTVVWNVQDLSGKRGEEHLGMLPRIPEPCYFVDATHSNPSIVCPTTTEMFHPTTPVANWDVLGEIAWNTAEGFVVSVEKNESELFKNIHPRASDGTNLSDWSSAIIGEDAARLNLLEESLLSALDRTHDYEVMEDCRTRQYEWDMAMNSQSLDPNLSVRLLLRDRNVVGAITGTTISYSHCTIVEVQEFLENPTRDIYWPVLISGSRETYYLDPKTQILFSEPSNITYDRNTPYYIHIPAENSYIDLSGDRSHRLTAEQYHTIVRLVHPTLTFTAASLLSPPTSSDELLGKFSSSLHTSHEHVELNTRYSWKSGMNSTISGVKGALQSLVNRFKVAEYFLYALVILVPTVILYAIFLRIRGRRSEYVSVPVTAKTIKESAPMLHLG